MAAVELIEGSGKAKLAHVIKTLGYNKDVDIVLATVLAPLPDIRVKIDNDKIELDAGDLVICEHLTQHTRSATVGGGTPTTITFNAILNVDDRVVVASVNDGQLYIVIDRIGGA